jgi:hypothetical protein
MDVEADRCVSCKVRTLFKYKSKSVPSNRERRSIGVFPM